MSSVRPMAITDLVALVNDWGSRPREVGHRPQPAGRPAAIPVADRVHEVFATADDRARAAAVTAMLAETEVRPELALGEDGFAATWQVPPGQNVLLAAAALALREQLAARPDRLGICSDGHCADVYVDLSPAGKRRFCSVTCQNRSRVAAYRKRHGN